MTVIRPHVCELELAKAEPDDTGHVLIAVMPGTRFTPEEARELATEISAAADAAAAYLAEQNLGEHR